MCHTEWREGSIFQATRTARFLTSFEMTNAEFSIFHDFIEMSVIEILIRLRRTILSVYNICNSYAVAKMLMIYRGILNIRKCIVCKVDAKLYDLSYSWRLKPQLQWCLLCLTDGPAEYKSVLIWSEGWTTGIYSISNGQTFIQKYRVGGIVCCFIFIVKDFTYGREQRTAGGCNRMKSRF